MQRLFESIFDVSYLAIVLTLGLILIRDCKRGTVGKLFGIMGVILGLGDGFHLVPRVLALNTPDGFSFYYKELARGKIISSITLTLSYLILYYIWRKRYKITGKEKLTISFFILAALRIILSLLPQNEWMSLLPPMNWAIYRNIPFVIMGILVIILFNKSSKKHNDKEFKNMHKAIFLSFIFYIPVVLFSDIYPLVGILMIPRTTAYLYIVYIGYRTFKMKTKYLYEE